jgi:hypothetical protein
MMEGKDCLDLVQDMGKWRVAVYTVKEASVSIE